MYRYEISTRLVEKDYINPPQRNGEKTLVDTRRRAGAQT